LDIRLVGQEDEQDWVELWTLYLEFYGTTRPKEVYQTAWNRIMDADEKMYSIMAFDEGKPVGLVNFLYHKSFWDIEDRVYLNDLYVDNTSRGSGLGRNLIKSVENHANEHNAAVVYWLTADDNKQAQNLYDKVATRTSFVKYQV
jgi:ribosomal protein S18 acetylase RimI-like enzyme